MSARLDSSLIDGIVTSFPHGSGWMTLLCNKIGRADGARHANWKSISHLRDIGGVYAFLLPKVLFQEDCEIVLDGPNRRQILFRFCADDLPAVGKHLVVYVGKAANLFKRFQWHFRLAKRNTGAQVQYGLVKSRRCRNRADAVRLMTDQATLVYHLLPGDEHTANRDIIEVSLCARFRAPFNIKSEH